MSKDLSPHTYQEIDELDAAIDSMFDDGGDCYEDDYDSTYGKSYDLPDPVRQVYPSTDTYEAIFVGHFNQHHLAIQVSYNAWIRSKYPDAMYKYRPSGSPEPQSKYHLWLYGNETVGLEDKYILAYFPKFGQEMDAPQQRLPDISPDFIEAHYQMAIPELQEIVATGYYNLLELNDLIYYTSALPDKVEEREDRVRGIRIKAWDDLEWYADDIENGTYQLTSLNNYIHSRKIVQLTTS